MGSSLDPHRSFLTSAINITTNARLGGRSRRRQSDAGTLNPAVGGSMLVTHLARQPARRLAQLALILRPIAASSAALAQGEVNIYSYREPQLIDPLLKAFTDKTGIKTNVVLPPPVSTSASPPKGRTARPTALHRRCRPPLRGQGCRPHAVRGLRRAEGRHPRPLPRSRQSLVRRSPCARASSTPPRSA